MPECFFFVFYLGSADKLNMHFRTKHDEDRLLDR